MCLVKDPAKRPSAEKLLRHSFFKQARSFDYIARHILEGLPPLGERVKDLKVHMFWWYCTFFLLTLLIVKLASHTEVYFWQSVNEYSFMCRFPCRMWVYSDFLCFL
jgi:hypothetical protein